MMRVSPSRVELKHLDISEYESAKIKWKVAHFLGSEIASTMEPVVAPGLLPVPVQVIDANQVVSKKKQRSRIGL